MGDQLRFTPDGPRHLNEMDLRNDGQPKVVVNPDNARIVARARFEPLVDETHHLQLMRELDRRAGTQRGKPRSRSPERNPLGCRLFDMGCGWPMYRHPYQQSFRYLCGLYSQSHATQCRHNHVDGPLATRFLLSCIRQRLLTPGFRSRLERRIRQLADRNRDQDGKRSVATTTRAALAELTRKRDRIAMNLALAENPEQHKAIATIFDQVSHEEKDLEFQLREAEKSVKNTPDLENVISAALEDFDHLADLAANDTDLGAAGEVFRQLNARLFLRFKEVQQKNRSVNKVAGGVVTFGSSPPPVTLYEGPTGRRALQGRAATAGYLPEVLALPSVSCGDVREGQSLGNVNRGDST
jgi:hypothetical protein